jgi:hypothetical protein
MSELETQLRRYGGKLRREAQPVTVDEIFARRSPTRHRWPAPRRVVVAAVCLAVLVALVGVVDRLLADRGQTYIATTDELPPFGAIPLPHAIVVALEDGVEVHPLATGSEPIRLASDQYYEAIRWAIPDGTGGLLYQHERTPPPWPPHTVLRLRAGAATPEPLPGWPPPESGRDDGTGGWLLGVGTGGDGRVVLLFVLGHQIWGIDVDGDDRWLLAERDGCIEAPGGMCGYYAIAGDSSVGILSSHDGCSTITVVRLDGSPVPPTDTCLPDRPFTRMALSDDGSTLVSLTVPFEVDSGVVTVVDLILTVTDLASGAVQETRMEAPDEFVDARIVARRGGWFVAVQTEAEVVLMDVASGELVPITSAFVTGERWTVAHHPLDLAAGATLGAGAGLLPCRPVSDRLLEQDLPPAVDATRQRLFDLASTCGYEELAELAWEQTTVVFVDGTTFVGPTREAYGFRSPDDLVRAWIADGLAPDERRSGLGEPLAWMAAVLNTTPTHVYEPSEVALGSIGRLGESVWLWPRVVVDNSDEAWEELASILGAVAVAELRSEPGFGGRYAGWWVGIAPGGMWTYFGGGDLFPPPSPVLD